MARPRQWERGCGSVPVLVPPAADLDAVRTGAITVAEYRARYEAHVLGTHREYPRLHPHLEPRWLLGHLTGAIGPIVVADRDTLCCACSREAAARGECHRVYAADLLKAHGWSVVLDGRAL